MTDLAEPGLDVEGLADPVPSDDAAMKVLLVTEGGYPYQFGGVSTWCRLLVGGLPDVDYHVLAITGDPDSEPMYDVPPNVSRVTTVPLWGARESLESRRDLGLRDLRRTRRTADGPTVTERLVPVFRSFVAALLADTTDPVEFAGTVVSLYEIFLTTDFDTSMRSRAVWDAFVGSAQAGFPAAAERAGYPAAPLHLSDVLTGMHWVTHWLLPLSRPLPAVDVVHATMAGSCTLPAVALKLHRGTRFVFSEHGVYLREAYLREASGRGSLFLKLLTLGFAHRTSELGYGVADAVSTCCDYNRRWQSRTGGSPERVSTVYYGLDPDAFGGGSRAETITPTVVWMGRIDPIKDLETLLRAAAVVHGARPDVRFRLYGAPAPGGEWYLEQVLELRGRLGLDDVVAFAGYTSDPRAAYAEADVVVLSSVSEGFPFSTLEAMACGKPVVATSVGGLDEQLGDSGLLVEPRDPAGLGEAVLRLVSDPGRARAMGDAARRRARTLFDLDLQNGRILELYSKDADADLDEAPAPAPAGAPVDRRRGALAAEGESAALVRLVDAAVPHPVDALEVATVIEANGVNDNAARAGYGAEDVFDLGEQVLGRLRADRAPATLRPHDLRPPSRQPRRVPEIGRGVLLLLPAVAVLLIGPFLTGIPGWTSGTGRALMLGVTASMVVANAVVLGTVRRSSLLVGCGRWTGARRFLWRASWVAALALLVGEAVGLSVAAWVGAVPGPELVTFALSFSGLGLFWIASSGFVALDRSDEPGAAVLVGVGVGVLVDRVLAAGSPRHLEIAIAVAYLTSLCIVVVRVRHHTRDRGGPDGYRRPGSAYVIDEALPYATYGGLLIALILGPNFLTAFVGTSPTVTGGDLSSIQVGMTLALLPLMVSLFGVDTAVQRFWETLCRALSAKAPGESAALCTEQRRWHTTRRLRFLAQVTVISALCVPAVWFLSDTTAFARLGVSSRSLFVSAFVVSLVAYLLLASAQFDSVMMLTLGLPGPAVRSLAVGVLVTAVVAVATSPLHYPEVGLVAMFAGTAVFAGAAWAAARRFMDELPYQFVRST